MTTAEVSPGYQLDYEFRTIEMTLACLLVAYRPRKLIVLAAIVVVGVAVFLTIGYNIAARRLPEASFIQLLPHFVPAGLSKIWWLPIFALAVPLLTAGVGVASAIISQKKWSAGIRLKPEGAEITSTDLHGEIRWKAFGRVIVLGQCAYLEMPNAYLLLPRRALADDSKWPEMIADVRSWIARAKAAA